jgi:hypothetical protein
MRVDGSSLTREEEEEAVLLLLDASFVEKESCRAGGDDGFEEKGCLWLLLSVDRVSPP